MKKNRKWYLLLLIVATLFIFACSDDEDPKNQTIEVEPDADNPIVNIFSPANNAIISVTDKINVDVYVVDAGEIAEVSLFVNGTLFNTITEMPWTFSWRQVSDALNVPDDIADDQGTYELTAKAVDVTGNESISNPVHVQLTHDNVPPTEPNNPSPAVESTDVQVVMPTLTWDSVDTDESDELTFELLYGNNPDLTDAIEVSGLTENEYQITGENLPFETEFFWQVTARDGSYTVVSPVWNFFTVLPLELPTEPYPSNEEEDVQISNVEFEWECSNYADDSPITYDFYFGDDNENLALVAEGLETTSFTLEQDLDYNKDYYWRVKSIDQHYPDGMMSSLWMFTTRHVINNPVSPIPANNTNTNPITDLQLGWTVTHEEGAELNYQVIVSTQTNFELSEFIIANVDGLTSNEYVIPEELTYAKKYYWRVYAKAGADSLEGPLWTFNTFNPISALSPEIEEEGLPIFDIQFDWEVVDIDDVTYDFYISTNDQLDALQPKLTDLTESELVYPISGIVDDPETVENEESVPLEIETTYYWRIVARHGEAGSADYYVIKSDIWSFDTKANPISDVTAPSPSHNSEDILVVNPTFSWTCSHEDGEPMNYEFWFGADEYSLTMIADNINQTTYQYDTTLEFNKEYRWQVVAKDGVFEKESSLWRLYTINPFGDPLPGNNEVGVPFDEYTFDWELEGYSEDGMTYSLYIATNEDDLNGAEAYALNLTDPHYTVTNLQPDTQYFWKARAINSDQLSDSDIWTFKTIPSELYNWVNISGGTYDVGTPNEDRYYDQQTIADFQMMDTEVTNLAYKAFIVEAINSGNAQIQGSSVNGTDGTEYYSLSNSNAKIKVSENGEYLLIEEGYENHPVSCVTWNGAVAFAEYYDYSLPTEWEWEIAARGGTTDEFPWGNDLPADNMVANYRNSGDEFDEGTTPVAYFPAYHNLYDMAGNVWEWTASDSDTVDGYKILRGGSWNSTINYLKCWVRNFDGTKNYDPEYSGSIIGFRCVK